MDRYPQDHRPDGPIAGLCDDRGMTPSRRRASTVASALVIVLALAAAACGPSTPTTTSSPSASPTAVPSVAPTATPAPSASAADVDALLDGIERQVSEIRGLESTTKLDREIIDQARLLELITEQYDKDSPPAYVAANERLYKALGLLPATMDLRATTLQMLESGVAGFYRPDQKKMYIVARTGALTVSDQVTYAHEFTHALQDEHWTAFSDQEGVLDRSDWFLGRQAAYEGDATTLMFQWALANLSAEQLQELLTEGTAPEQQAIIDALPAILRESLLYPYTTGYAFVQGIQFEGGWEAVDALFERLPESTEQILHPETYAADDRPVDVELPADLAASLGDGWTVPLFDTFGEFQTTIWLREGGAVDPEAAAAGWGGDRLAVINGPDGAWSLAWQTVWDTTDDAAAFEIAATAALSTAGGVGTVLPGAGGTTRWVVVANDDATLQTVAGVLGLAG